MPNPVRFSSSAEDRDYVRVNVPCQAACPASTNVPAYIRALFEGDPGRSYEINRVANILPGVLGRICSRPCEERCRHGEPELGRPVNICHLKRAAADFRPVGAGADTPIPPPLGKRAAVIGAGPAGLAAAHDLAAVGIAVTLFEALPEPGGMLRYGIPEFRLPRTLLKAEIDRILQLGVTLRTGLRVGRDLSMEQLLQGHDAVLVSAGCYDANALDVPGETLAGVFSGLGFMMEACSGRPPEVGRRVLVVGAGFTAFDCARTALRLGADDVAICLRRSEQDLTVTADEIHEAKVEGIRLESLMLSRRILGGRGVEGVEFVRTRPGETREDGKRTVAPIDGSEFILPADTLIVATGQKAAGLDGPGEKDRRGVLRADSRTFRSSVPGLYVAGDHLSGPSTAIQAIAAGRAAAEQMARDLCGRRFREPVIRMEETRITDRERTWDFLPRQPMPTAGPVADRLRQPGLEVETGLTPEAALEESKRCYLCHLHYEIDMDRCIYCRYCIDVAPRDCIKLVSEVRTNENGAITELVETASWRNVSAVVIDNARCIRCGECMRVCPVECISVTRVELVERPAADPDGKEQTG